MSADGRLVGQVVRFSRLLREAGLSTTPTQATEMARALDLVGVDDRSAVKAAGRAIFVQRREQLEIFDRAFEAFWRVQAEPSIELGRMKAPVDRPREVVGAVPVPGAPVGSDLESLDVEIEQPVETYSNAELLTEKNFASLTPGEAEQIRALIERRAFRLKPRRTRRLRAARRGPRLDLRQTLRLALRTGGEPLRLGRRARVERPRPLVVLCDVSGSMAVYSRILLHFLWAVGRTSDRWEGFLFSTRLTRVTRELRERSVDVALRRAGDVAPDFGGGTRIGEALDRFNRVWGRRVLRRGAVVLVISDGWDRGEPRIVEAAMERLAMRSSRVIWLNPHLGDPRYEPLTRGMQAALPWIDDFLPVHNLRSLDELSDLLGSLEIGSASVTDWRRRA